MIFGEPQKIVPACPVQLPHSQLKAQVCDADWEVLKTPWHWCTSVCGRGAGPEHLSLGSVQYQAVGSRQVLLVEYSSALRFAQSTRAPGSTLSVAQIVDMVSEADANFIKVMHEQGVKMMKATVDEHQSLYCPWGWMQVSAPLNREENCGYRWVVASDYYTAAFPMLASAMLPVGKVAGNTAMALLSKLITGLQATPGEGCSEDAVIKMKLIASGVVQAVAIPKKEATASAAETVKAELGSDAAPPKRPRVA